MSNMTLDPLGGVRYAGLDVSALSGEIDFATVRASGRAAVYIRASVAGDYADPSFEANYISARENGLLAGAYHVLTARTPEQARAQARFFAQTVACRELQLRPALVFDCLAGLTAANANAIALAFLETVEAELGSAAIRADAQTAQSLWSAAIASRFPLWLTGCDAAVGGNWSGWSGRQYAAHARVEGVSGPAGLDGFTDGMLAGAAAVPANEAAVPTLASASALASAAQTYTVRRGDTLSEIAARFGTTVNELVRLNNIADPDRIYEGDRLIIRAGAGDGDTYTVQRGDTLSEIAARFGTTVNALVRLNNIADRDLIYPGQVLIIRENGGSVTPPSGAVTYTVQRNDNLTEIAARFGTTVAELVRLNNIADPNRIYPGQVLIIRESGGSTPPSGATTYTVQRNDNLTEIAARFGTTVAELVRLNNIANPNLIYPGQVLIIRESGGVTPPSGAVTYTVQRNDNLTEIAARFGTTVAELVRLNNIADPNLIYPGQVLIIRESGGSTPPSGATTYTVQRGDNLTEIAARFGTTVAELVRLNNIADPNLIYPGQVLVIRESGGSTPPSGTTTYTVQRGDTLSEIAERFGTTVSALVMANNIADRDRIYPGQVLVIPAGGCVDNYIVQRGDTLSGIAQRFGTTVARLASLNNIRNTDR
ncbi:MAG TPA: LysM peptidoglycan-binding domain-containing protein, partial [Candidatus Pullichristensenella stercoripullorum]|nr:LysM peptidoglycan-binding domain-containing protein [Candidatus Pullichristensenella stercoripullorum]